MDKNIPAKFENRVWIILLVVLTVVLISGFFVYRSLSTIINDLSEEARPDETVLLIKDVMKDLTEAENHVKSYSLTSEAHYLEDYNQDFANVTEKLVTLDSLTQKDSDSGRDVDTLKNLIDQKFLILEDMLLLRGQSRVSSALDKVVNEIETSEAVTPTETSQLNIAENEELKSEEDKFFKKLLNRRKKDGDPVEQSNGNNAVAESNETGEEKLTLEEINREIVAIKREEEQIDKSVREKELFLIQEDKKVMERINAVYQSMEARETLSMEEKLTLADSKSTTTKIVIALFCIVACGLLVLAGYAVNTYVKRNDAFKLALKRAKQETDQKNREITDSITYAKRIQEAILPDRNLFHTFLREAFIYYKPKDIVAGDFYWTVKTSDRVFFAVADCTGHGVPGAMVSVVCNTALNRCVREFGLTNPAAILDKCRQLVLETFDSGNYLVNDGMDIALVSLRYETRDRQEKAIIEFAGANNSLYIVQNGNLQDIKPDKQPVGRYQNPKPFTNHELVLQKDTMLYLFTDGFADQFGGPYGKKYKYRQFQELLSRNSVMDISKQHNYLADNFESWRGALEQIDDVCILGVRV